MSTFQYTLNIITPPLQNPVSLDLASRACRIDSNDDMDLLLIDVKASTGFAERFLNRSLITKTYSLNINHVEAPNQGHSFNYMNPNLFVYPLNFMWNGNFSSRGLELLRSPVQSVQAVTIYKWDGTQVSLTLNTDYYLDTSTEPARIKFVPFDANLTNIPHNEIEHINIQYTAGYGDSHESIPDEIKSALLKMILRLWENRGESDAGPIYTSDIRSMLSQYRIASF